MTKCLVFNPAIQQWMLHWEKKPDGESKGEEEKKLQRKRNQGGGREWQVGASLRSGQSGYHGVCPITSNGFGTKNKSCNNSTLFC